MRSPTGAGFKLLLGLWLLQSSAYFIPAATWSPVSRLGLTRALAEGPQLQVGDFAELTGDRALRDGRWYSDKAPLPSLLAVPTYAALRLVHHLASHPEPHARPTKVVDAQPLRLRVNRSFSQLLYISAVATAGLGGALIGVLLFDLLRRRFGARPALLATALTMLGTPLFPYATSFFGHVPAGAFLIAAAWLLDGPAAGLRRVAGAGACLALAVGCEYLAALPGAALGLRALLVPSARSPEPRLGSVGRRLAALLAGAAWPTAALMGYHAACFGGPLRTGYGFVQNEVFKRGHARGFMGIGLPDPEAMLGLTFGVERGLFWLAPISLVGLAGLLAYLWRQRDATVLALSLGLLALFVVNAGYYMWWGGAATGPRHLVPALPVLAFGVAQAFRVPTLRVGLLLLGALSVANMLSFTAVGPDAPEGRDTLITYAYHHLLRGELAQQPGASNLAIELGLAAGGSLGPLLCWWLLGGRALWVRLTPEVAP